MRRPSASRALHEMCVSSQFAADASWGSVLMNLKIAKTLAT